MNTELDQQLAEILSNDLENNENNNTVIDKIIHESLLTMEKKLLTEDRINQDKEYNESLQYDLQKLKSNELKKIKSDESKDFNESNESNGFNKCDTFNELSPKSLREARLKYLQK